MNVKKIFNSSTKVKIVNFFHRNPATIDTAKGIATWVDCDPDDVYAALEDLVKRKVLIAHRTSSTTAYAYTQDKLVTALIGKFLKNAK